VTSSIAVVTGANKGIGFEIARQLAGLDIQVVLTARDADRGRAATAELASASTPPVFHPLDVTSDASISTLAAYLDQAYGRVDILVNNAGVALDKWRSALDLDLDTLRTTMETNVYGAFAVLKHMVPLLERSGRARVVNLASVLGSLESMGGLTLAYRMSKTALNALTRVMADELAPRGILLNSLWPGWVKTALGGDDAPRSPQEAADTCIWLATLGDGGPTGGFFKDREPLPW
jgi:NAD(P)-dependent dehydrogenase (short-subunit alcohol dehydrogenase family)